MSPTSTAARLADPAAGLAAFLASGVAVLLLAVGDSVLPGGTSSEIAYVVAAVFTVVATAGLQRSGSRRTAWSLAAGAALVLGSLRVLVPGDASADTLGVVGLIAAATTGVLLGAAIAGGWGSAGGQWALLSGVWAAFFVAAAVGGTVPVDSIGWTVPRWALAGALFATIAAVITVRSGMRVQRADPRLLATVVAAAVALTVGYRLLGNLVESRATGGGAMPWLIAGGALALAVVGAELTARVVPPTDERFVLAVTGAVAASYPMVVELWVVARSPGSWWAPLLVVGAVVAGVRLAAYLPYALPGLLVAAAVSAASVGWPEEFGLQVPFAVRVAVVAAGAGLALGASLPGSASVAALGLSLPVPLTAVVGAVWTMPAEPRWVVLTLAAAATVCAWQVR